MAGRLWIPGRQGKGVYNAMDILRTERLCKTYGQGENRIHAVDDVSLSVARGEFVVVVGSSGSGKSTLLHLLGGVDRPDSGRVIIEEEDIYRLKDDQLAVSGGQQQRVAIGRALITRPAILLADEPTGNLDTRAGNEIMELLKLSNRKYKQTIIMITHNLELAKQADRVLKMEDGRIRDGRSGEVLA